MQVSGIEPANLIPQQASQPQPAGNGGGVSADQAGSSQAKGQGGRAHDPDADTADFSPDALAAANRPYPDTPDAPGKRGDDEPTQDAPTKPGEQQKTGTTDSERKATGEALTTDEQEQVQQLKDQDRETRAHEQAHKSAAGSYAQGGPTFEYQQGPDGRRYAVSGSVSIDSSAIPDDPQATIQKMQVVRRAALAPSNPSGQDRKVAAQASQSQQKAQVQLQQSREDETAATEDADTPDRDAPGLTGFPGASGTPQKQGLQVDLSA
jgi:SprA-related family